jgi:hypothetical protein
MTMARSKENPKIENHPHRRASDDIASDDVCCLLFKQVQKPEHYMMCKATNVYDNKYRINVYTKHEEEGLFKQRISNSYFAKLNETGSLEILMGNEPPVESKNKKHKMW